ncbi:restriction endonuclease subunit S [Campylobacter devanensis]|nr:restriction endonuclease subunit S [Campylobacter sp. P0138]
MSKLDELINKLCPNGVEFKKIEGITKSVNIGINPRRFFKLNPDDATGFYVTVRELNGLKGVNQTEKTDLINDEAIKIIQARANIENGDILFSNTGTVGKMALVDYETLNWGVNEGIYIIKPKHEIINSKFLYYYLDSNLAYADYSRMLTGSTMKHITQKALLSISIPVPPLEVQCEIVRILDNFTLLSAELSAELSARQKQYEYYSNELFNFEKRGIEYKTIKFEEIARFSQGIQVDVDKQFFEPFDNSVPFLRIVDFVNSNESPRYIEKPDDKYIKKENEMIMIRYGASACGKVFTNKFGAIANNMFKINIKDNKEIDINYLKFYLSQKSIYEKLNGSSGKSTMPAINFGYLNKFEIPLPSIEEQKNVVVILEKLEKICNDISDGLPAEIEARKKQYEYYRDKLLTFKELK